MWACPQSWPRPTAAQSQPAPSQSPQVVGVDTSVTPAVAEPQVQAESPDFQNNWREMSFPKHLCQEFTKFRSLARARAFAVMVFLAGLPELHRIPRSPVCAAESGTGRRLCCELLLGDC